jgi:DNA-binding beta-propeller fold protein YncE
VRNALGAVTLATATLLTILLPSAQPATALQAGPEFQVIGTFPVPAGGAEIGAATVDGRYLAVTAAETKKVAILDLRNPAAPTQTCAFDTSAYGEPTSVDIPNSGRYALVAVKNDPSPGTVVAISVPGCQELWRVAVGIGPDSIVITPNGEQALVAIEDEEIEVDDPAACPAGNARPGRLDLIDLRGRGAGQVTPVAISLAGVAGVNCPNDPQPEGIAVSPDSKVAFITLQENNALATIDLRAEKVASIISMGTTTHLADVVDDKVVAIDDPYTGRRESDGIAISHDGRWLFTADEGDTENTASAFSGGRTMSVLSATRFRGWSGHDWEDDPDEWGQDQHGRPGPGGPAGPTIRPPVVVADTGAQIETVAAANGALPNGRADNRGPEPEGIAWFRVGPRELVAVTLERSNGVIIFDVSNPRHPTAITFIPTGDGPEGALYIQSRKLLITTNEVGASITVICARMGGDGCR